MKKTKNKKKKVLVEESKDMQAVKYIGHPSPSGTVAYHRRRALMQTILEVINTGRRHK